MDSITIHRETAVYIADLAEVADDYDEVVAQMKNVAKSGEELTADERKLLQTGYSMCVGKRRYAWEKASTLEKKEESQGNEDIAIRINVYKRKIETEITNTCVEILSILDEHLIPSSTTPDGFVFYYAMKGDYYRYLAEIKTGTDRQANADLALQAYEIAVAAAEADLTRADPVRVRVDLNLAILHQEIMGNTERACEIADKTFDEAFRGLSNLSDEEKKESSNLLSSLNAKMTVWSKLSNREEFTLD